MASQYFPTGTVYGVLLNFSAERAALAAQMSQPPYKAPPQAPVLYIKTANTWSASGASVPVPASVGQVEVGAAVAMVIGPVMQYVLMNDLSIPHASFFRPPVKFKCLDGFLGVGSQRVTADDPASFKLEIRINGDLRQTVDFSNLVRSASTLLADVSEFMTLREGDVLMLGCDCLPGGGRPLAKAGDVIQISSPSHPALGVLVNTLVAETS
jgi:5-oxopent-3-ene-1,2,5-tricarboxylate decarboxylase / 2-hydroxyhepta-2,4-diene-1,7-dioate isomerase